MTTRRRSHWEQATWPVLLLLATLHVWMAVSASSRFGSTGDENAHITGGLTYWKFNDYRLHPENGNLAQRITTLPLLFQDTILPSRDQSAWIHGSYWPYSDLFFYDLNNDLPRILAWSRLMNALLGGGLVIASFLWSRSLFGRGAAWCTAVLIAFSPEVLAHAGLANSDVSTALAFTLALAAWWKLMHEVTPKRVILAGLATGVLALCKFSALLLAPVVAGLLVIRLFKTTPIPVGTSRISSRKQRGWTKAGALGSGAFGALLLAFMMIWAAYGFRYQSASDTAEPPSWEWDSLLSIKGEGMDWIGSSVSLAREHQLLPQAWLFGLTYVDRHSKGRPAFLAGESKVGGWHSFFPVAFLTKTTVGAMVLALLATILPWRIPKRRIGRQAYRLAPILLFIAVYGTVAITGNINIGHRHILPLYPMLYILCGAAWLTITLRPSKLLRGILLACLGAHVTASAMAYPYYLAYFNELAGGSRSGYRILVDSSLDWGQGLPELKEWVTRNTTDEPVYLCYFGSDRPKRVDLRITRVADNFFHPRTASPPPERLEPGVYCISATMLQQVYTPLRGPWDKLREKNYWELRAQLAAMPATAPERTELFATFDYVRFNRLCWFLRHRSVDDSIGHSILIYRLSAEELEICLDTPLTGRR